MFGDKPEIGLLKGMGEVPVPPYEIGVVELPYLAEFPQSNHEDNGDPFGLMEPYSVAPEVPIDPAGCVVAVGGIDGCPGITQERSAPYAVPLLFCPAMRKWYVVPGVKLDI